MSSAIRSLPQARLNHLWRKILFTLGFLAIYRIGVYVPIPGVDAGALGQFFSAQGQTMFGMFNRYTGGALEQFSVLALGVMPYISASIIAQLLTVVVPQLEQLSKEGEAGRKKITQYTRYGTVILALGQGYVIASVLESQSIAGQSLVYSGGLAWRVLTALSLTAGTAFVMWLGEQITERGVGNGISLIIFAGIVASLPKDIAQTYQQYAQAEMDLPRVVLICAIMIAVIAGVVFMEQGARQIPVQYAKRQVGRKMYGGQTSHLPLRLNVAGVIPPIFASSLLQFPLMVGSSNRESVLGELVSTVFFPGSWGYNLLYVLLIIFFAFFYTSIVFKPDDVAENLKKHQGSVPGIRPGARTAEYLNGVISRLTVSGSIYLSAICILPTVIADRFNVPFSFGGTSLLIVVGVALETFRQIDAHRQSLRYEAFLKQGTTIRPRRQT